MRCDVQIEPLYKVLSALLILSSKEYSELGVDNSIPYNPDVGELLKYELGDKSVLVTARYDSVLVGYALYLIGPFKHSHKVDYANLEGIWLSPSFRAGMTASRMLKLGEEELRKHNVHFIMASSSVKYPIDILLNRSHYEPVETVYMKRLNNV